MDNEDTRVPTVHIESGGPIIDDTQLEHWGATPWPISTRFILENTWRSFSTNSESGRFAHRSSHPGGTPAAHQLAHHPKSLVYRIQQAPGYLYGQ